MGAGRLSLDPAELTLAHHLRSGGYASLALTANGMLAPLLSLEGSYQAYRSAEWWEKTFRWLPPERFDFSPSAGVRSGKGALSVLGSAFTRRRTRERAMAEFLRAPGHQTTLAQALHETRPEEAAMGRLGEAITWGTIDGMNRVARALRWPGDPRPLPDAPWIEATLAGWLARTPPDQPVHCFVNLLDAHEKYLSDAELVRGLRGWLRFVRIPQNARLWLQGDWRPTEDELDLLRRLYERTLRRLDLRLGALIEILRHAGRWDNTLLVVTSDHGQAFGEHGELFHERSPYEPLLHVPLMIRWPGGMAGGGVRSEAVSLVDVVPTLLKAARRAAPANLPGAVLTPTARIERPQPVQAMADGFPSLQHYREHLSDVVRDRLRRSFAVAYDGDFKVILGLHDQRIEIYNLVDDPGEEHDLGTAAEGTAARAVETARTAARSIGAARSGAVDPQLQFQLESWGY